MKITDEMLSQFVPEAEKLWLESLPSDDQISAHIFSRSFERAMKKLIREQKRSPFVKDFMRFAKRAAAIVLLTVAVAFSALMTVDAYRAKFIEMIEEIFDDLTHYSFTSSQKSTMQRGRLILSYLPEGLTEIEHYISEPLEESFSFEDENGRLLQVSLNFLTENSSLNLLLDTEDAKTTTIPFKDGSATLVEKDGMSTLLWDDDSYVFLVLGDFPAEEVLKVANGITVTK